MLCDAITVLRFIYEISLFLRTFFYFLGSFPDSKKAKLKHTRNFKKTRMAKYGQMEYNLK